MKQAIPFFLALFLLAATFVGCSSDSNKQSPGKLFIIGGGERPPALMQAMLDAADLHSGDYVLILPFASGVPRESATRVSGQLTDLGVQNIAAIFLDSDSLLPASAIDSVRRAAMIYITGGDQNQFMAIAQRTGLTDAIMEAFQGGAMIAGTSAGAAVMSKKMITGNQLSQAVYSGSFKTIHQNNIEIKEGLGLLPTAIVDQHFIQRMRMNRLIAVAIENPSETCIGIDESTAILVKNNRAEIVGSSQVIVLEVDKNAVFAKKGMLGADGIKMKVLLPGQSFAIN